MDEADGMDDLRARLAGVSRFAEDLERRMVDAGAPGLAGVVAAYERIRAALDAIGIADLDRALAEIGDLQRRLATLAVELGALRRVKDAVAR